MSRLNVKCPICERKALSIYRELRKVKSPKSLTGTFIVPTGDPIVVCLLCGSQFYEITCDGDEVKDYKLKQLFFKEDIDEIPSMSVSDF